MTMSQFLLCKYVNFLNINSSKDTILWLKVRREFYIYIFFLIKGIKGAILETRVQHSPESVWGNFDVRDDNSASIGYNLHFLLHPTTKLIIFQSALKMEISFSKNCKKWCIKLNWYEFKVRMNIKLYENLYS